MADQPTKDELVAAVIEDMPAVIQETKAGYKTTEFWITVGASLLTVLNAVPLPEKYEGVVVAALGVAYVLSRGIAKKGVPHIAAPTA